MASNVVTLHDRRTGEEVPSVALAPVRPVLGLIRPIAPPQEVLRAQEDTRAMIAEILQEGRDYGKIPGCGDKPAMLKPGAERTQMAFGCYSRFRVVEKEVDHDREVPWLKRKKEWKNGSPTGNWLEERGTSLGLYRYVVECEIVHRESETVVGSCIATCSTMESKYIDRPRDSENTVLKMAEKRAHVGAVLNAFGLSEQFTQDIEENPDLYRRDQGGEGAATSNEPPAKCPKCQGAMWDNRPKKASGQMKDTAPDFKCRDKECGGTYWPGQWPPKPLEALAEQIRAMIVEIAAIDTELAKQTEQYAEGVLQRADATEEEVKKVGRQVRGRLQRLQEAVRTPSQASEPQQAPLAAVPVPASADDGIGHEPDHEGNWDDELPF